MRVRIRIIRFHGTRRLGSVILNNDKILGNPEYQEMLLRESHVVLIPLYLANLAITAFTR
jgi:hypothetical protein